MFDYIIKNKENVNFCSIINNTFTDVKNSNNLGRSYIDFLNIDNKLLLKTNNGLYQYNNNEIKKISARKKKAIENTYFVRNGGNSDLNFIRAKKRTFLHIIEQVVIRKTKFQDSNIKLNLDNLFFSKNRIYYITDESKYFYNSKSKIFEILKEEINKDNLNNKINIFRTTPELKIELESLLKVKIDNLFICYPCYQYFWYKFGKSVKRKFGHFLDTKNNYPSVNISNAKYAMKCYKNLYKNGIHLDYWTGTPISDSRGTVLYNTEEEQYYFYDRLNCYRMVRYIQYTTSKDLREWTDYQDIKTYHKFDFKYGNYYSPNMIRLPNNHLIGLINYYNFKRKTFENHLLYSYDWKIFYLLDKSEGKKKEVSDYHFSKYFMGFGNTFYEEDKWMFFKFLYKDSRISGVKYLIDKLQKTSCPKNQLYFFESKDIGEIEFHNYKKVDKISFNYEHNSGASEVSIYNNDKKIEYSQNNGIIEFDYIDSFKVVLNNSKIFNLNLQPKMKNTKLSFFVLETNYYSSGKDNFIPGLIKKYEEIELDVPAIKLVDEYYFNKNMTEYYQKVLLEDNTIKEIKLFENKRINRCLIYNLRLI